jgi:D-glycero-alpha-D-manno-heptose 1-phosphate guanylyltransferase
MEAAILADGLGTRLRAAVPDLPKPMAAIAGRPFLEIVLASLARKGFCALFSLLGTLAEKSDFPLWRQL